MNTPIENVTCGMCFGKASPLADKCPHCGNNPNLTLDGPPPPRSHRLPWWKDALGDPSCPYIRRYVLDLRWFSIRLHHWLSDDDQRAHHDHPWWFLTLVLWGSYHDLTLADDGGRVTIHTPERGRQPYERVDTLQRGSIRFRRANHAHTVRTKGCWTLLITGPRERAFGFWVARKDNGVLRFIKANKFFATFGHPPCTE